ncbi:hypothetical protein SEA_PLACALICIOUS_41 [Mycobacterium phage Placalicious]|uniref:Uncharacterized protein n=1 Tax=Mycobacterium phage Placalicious TaxID=2250407 RepID=A0A345KTI0_9CAUD|nr:hypothetical protein SEA_FUGATEOSU_41 [Mycobacterium phage FugateOSU]AXH46332.1 hypothetical protein SEA_PLACALICIOUS_41 [Mycobacterium phage Placalicious]
MATIRRGAAAPYKAIYHGTTPIKQVRRGETLLWSQGKIRDDFTDILDRWLNELLSGDLGALCSDVTGVLRDGLGNIVGHTVAFVEDNINGLGKLVAQTGQDLATAYCGVWGGTAAPNGLIGLINGIPIFGGILADWLKGELDIVSIIGSIPIIGDIGRLIGLIPDALGNLADPINYVVDAFGEVIGTITCGQFRPHGGDNEGICYTIGVLGDIAKMLIPDGLLTLNRHTSRLRHETLLDGDDGYLEVQVADLGAPDYPTQVFRRYANNGSGDTGVGMQFMNSQVSLVRRVGGNNTLVLPQVASYSPGDVLRLEQFGDIHSITRNGETVGVWEDNSATAAKGVNNRSVAMIMQGAKELNTSRKVSPGLAYLEAA